MSSLTSSSAPGEPSAPTRRQWQELVAAALVRSGRMDADEDPAQAESILTSTTYDGIRIRPLYTADDEVGDGRIAVAGVPAFVRAARSGVAVPDGWDVRQRHLDPDPQLTRAAVHSDLENGADSLWLGLGPGGLPVEALPQILEGVPLEKVPVVLDAGPATEAAASGFLRMCSGEPAPGSGLGADPLGLRARLGSGVEPDLGLLARLAGRCADTVRVAVVDVTVHHDAGAGDAQELGASIATGVAYLRALTDAGLGIEEAFARLEFRYAASADQFLVTAKLRAARRLWARVAEVCGLTQQPADPVAAQRPGQCQHVVTSSAMMTRYDPWVNLLRTTVAAVGAGIGGADAITVQPFDAAIGLPDAFSRRLARNTGALLVLEAHLARVIDPAGGSWYVEQLTDELAAAGWEQFTAIEAAGGMAAVLESGRFATEIEQVRRDRRRNLALRNDAAIGVSEFPDLGADPVTRRPYPDGYPVRPARADDALPVYRYAQDYEELRDAAAADPQRARIFLATIGPAAKHTARAGFAAGLFQAGGLATPTVADFIDRAATDRAATDRAATDPAVIAAAFTASGAVIACLASSADLYAEHAEAVVAALRAAGAQYVLLAGRRHEYAGADGYVGSGVDAVAVLRDLHRRIGIGS